VAGCGGRCLGEPFGVAVPGVGSTAAMKPVRPQDDRDGKGCRAVGHRAHQWPIAYEFVAERGVVGVFEHGESGERLRLE
jgi:hypothetical protein